MSTQLSPASERVWSVIEREKQRDKLVRRVSVTAWSVTCGAVLVFGGITAAEVWRIVGHAIQGMAPWPIVFKSKPVESKTWIRELSASVTVIVPSGAVDMIV